MTNKYDNLSDAKIAADIAELDGEIALFSEERKALLAELARRFEEKIKAAYEKAAKAHGKVTLRADGFDVEIDTRQKVEWDQAKLNAAGEAMKPEEAQHILKLELSVSEKTYNALPPGDVKKALTDARTTTLQAPSIKVVFPKEKS